MSDQTGNPQQPGDVPPPAPDRGVARPADLGPRFVARLIDFVLLGVANSVLVGALVAGVLLGTDTAVVEGWGLGSGMSWAANAVTTVASTLLVLAYFVLMEHHTGQTVGKMLLKLETRGPTGGRPTLEEALRRNAWTAIGILGVVPFLGWLSGLLSLAAVITIMVTISRSTDRHGWHDDFAGGTTVVRLG